MYKSIHQTSDTFVDHSKCSLSIKRETFLSTSKQFLCLRVAQTSDHFLPNNPWSDVRSVLESRLIVADDSIAIAVNVTLRRFINDVNNMQTVGRSDASVCLSRGRGKINARADRRVYVG